jgi:hypothetical protein
MQARILGDQENLVFSRCAQDVRRAGTHSAWVQARRECLWALAPPHRAARGGEGDLKITTIWYLAICIRKVTRHGGESKWRVTLATKRTPLS